jgi:hypothetical protein
MTGDEATLAVIDVFDQLKVPYMLVGSFSTNLYGIPRSTEDADFVVESAAFHVRLLAENLGPAFRLDPQMTFETATMTFRHVFEVVGTDFKIEVFYLSDDPHDQERFRRRRRITLLGHQVCVPTPEDVIITKIRWVTQIQRLKDFDDARNVIAVQGSTIDWQYVYSWCDRHGTRETLDEVRRSIPPI